MGVNIFQLSINFGPHFGGLLKNVPNKFLRVNFGSENNYALAVLSIEAYISITHKPSGQARFSRPISPHQWRI